MGKFSKICIKFRIIGKILEKLLNFPKIVICHGISAIFIHEVAVVEKTVLEFSVWEISIHI